MSKTAKHPAAYWATPAICVIAGLAYLISAWISGRPGLGVGMMLIMLVFGAGVMLAGRRSETIRGLLDRRDERITAIDLKASAAAGVVLVVAVLAGAIVELARGNSGDPFTWLAAIAGTAYAVAVIVLRMRG